MQMPSIHRVQVSMRCKNQNFNNYALNNVHLFLFFSFVKALIANTSTNILFIFQIYCYYLSLGINFHSASKNLDNCSFFYLIQLPISIFIADQLIFLVFVFLLGFITVAYHP